MPAIALTPWQRRLSPQRANATRLVCLPHAGGSWHLYADWPGLLPDVDVVAIQYPGRQDRIREPLPTDLKAVSAAVAADLNSTLDGTETSVVLFGHSMGAAIAFEVACRLQLTGRSPEMVFVSARPSLISDERDQRPTLDDAGLVDAIRDVDTDGGEIYARQELWPLILPPLRADLTMLAAYQSPTLSRISCPIVAFGGSRDPTCPPDRLVSWEKVTGAGCDTVVFDGGHHFLMTNARAVANEVGRRLQCHH